MFGLGGIRDEMAARHVPQAGGQPMGPASPFMWGRGGQRMSEDDILAVIE